MVVDNSSEPAVAAVAGGHGCTYVDPGRNLGFAGGVNLGCARREGRDVLLLNPDAAVTPAAVRALHAALTADPGSPPSPRRSRDPAAVHPTGWPGPSPPRVAPGSRPSASVGCAGVPTT